MNSLTKEELEQRLATFVGVDIGDEDLARDPVNETMIRHWCEAMGDNNPVYTDAEAAAASVHGGIVSPPSMLQAWMLPGIEMADPARMRPTRQTELHKLLSDNGYTGVVATNCEQSYHRYLKPGDRLRSTTRIEAVSGEKATALGIGYFINTRETFRDQDGEEVAWQTFRVLKFKPAERPAAAPSEGQSSAPAKPKRLRPPKGHDNGWWWEGIDAGKLLIQKCSGCGELRHPPQPMCAYCRSIKWESIESGGKGLLYSYTVMQYPKFPGYDYPLICALVELSEGTRLVSNVLDCDPGDLQIGMELQLSIEAVDDELMLPVFRPVKRK